MCIAETDILKFIFVCIIYKRPVVRIFPCNRLLSYSIHGLLYLEVILLFGIIVFTIRQIFKNI